MFVTFSNVTSSSATSCAVHVFATLRSAVTSPPLIPPPVSVTRLAVSSIRTTHGGRLAFGAAASTVTAALGARWTLGGGCWLRSDLQASTTTAATMTAWRTVRLYTGAQNSPMIVITANDSAALSGIVRTQATTMLPATPHRTAEIRFVAPTPMMHALMQCVVETGTPRRLATMIVTAPAVSAAKPCNGVMRMILLPI